MTDYRQGPDDEAKNVVSFSDFRSAKEADTRHAVDPPGEAVALIDSATRDLHAAASTTLRMICLARRQIGLPNL